MSYFGAAPTGNFISTASQRVTGSTNNYVDLDHAISALSDVIILVNSVKQDITNLTFTSASRITLGGTLVSSDVVEIVYLGKSVATQTPGTSTVTNDMLAGSIANAKLANSSISINGSSVSLGGSLTGIGEANTPAFAAVFSGAGSGLANGTYVKLAFDSELYDSGSVYDTSNYRFTPGVAGKYFIHARTLISAASTSPNQGRIAIYKNGSLFNFWRWTNTASISDFSMQISAFADANTTDYYEAYIYQNNTGSSTSFSINSDPSQTSLFMGYKITT